jgi:hypothetical protein
VRDVATRLGVSDHLLYAQVGKHRKVSSSGHSDGALALETS